MSQNSNFEIPARFVFNPLPAHWVACSAEIVGWSAGAGRTEPREIIAVGPLDDEQRTRKRIEALQVVQVRLGILRSVFSRGFSAGYPSLHHQTIEVLRSDLPADVLGPSENARSQPDISGRCFTLLVSLSPELLELGGNSSVASAPKDAWRMRDEFLNLPHQTEALCEFLNRWGHWDSTPKCEVGPVGSEGLSSFPLPVSILLPQKVWKAQSDFRTALTRTPKEWLRNAGSLVLAKIEVPPYFVVRQSYCSYAIKDTITIDHLEDVKFGVCKRQDCRKLFERRTKQRRLYCSHSCAHTVSVRNQRKEQKRLKRKLKGAKGHAKG